MKRGLVQGSLNGPLTFILVFDPFLQRLQSISASNLEVFGFVDDATTVAIEDNACSTITSSILYEAPLAAEDIKMKLNAKKTQLIIVDFTRTKKSKNWKFTLDGAEVETVSSARLLGVIFNGQLTWEDHVNSIVSKASRRLWILRKLKQLGFKEKELTLLLKSSIIPILEYASPVWGPGLTIAQSEFIERVQWRGVQTICGNRVKMSSVEYDLTLSKLGLSKLAARREDMAFSFGMSILKSSYFRHWLPPFNEGKSRLRKHNLFTPVKARTSRYKNSPIPFIVNLLNEKFLTYPELFSNLLLK